VTTEPALWCLSDRNRVVALRAETIVTGCSASHTIVVNSMYSLDYDDEHRAQMMAADTQNDLQRTGWSDAPLRNIH
jgi:hypothetical protein